MICSLISTAARLLISSECALVPFVRYRPTFIFVGKDDNWNALNHISMFYRLSSRPESSPGRHLRAPRLTSAKLALLWRGVRCSHRYETGMRPEDLLWQTSQSDCYAAWSLGMGRHVSLHGAPSLTNHADFSKLSVSESSSNLLVLILLCSVCCLTQIFIFRHPPVLPRGSGPRRQRSAPTL